MNITGIRKRNQNFFMRSLSLFICIALIMTGIPFHANAAVTMKKFIKADPQVFIPSKGEQASITWNFETKHPLNVMIMDGDKVIAYLAKNQEYEGNYEEHGSINSREQVIKDRYLLKSRHLFSFSPTNKFVYSQ